MVNLLTNAAKYTPTSGRIELRAEQIQNDVLISIADTGIGLSMESLPAAFEMFTQVGHNSPHSQGGLGIGLSLVKHFVEMHGGTVTAASPGIGNGSIFTVRIPLMLNESNSGVTNEPIGEAPSDGQKRKLRILVADDNLDAAETLASLLQIHGHATRVAHGGDQALRIAHEFLPDMAFLDIGMPGMDGFEVAQSIKRTPKLQATVLVALTGWGSEYDRMRSREAGFFHHLTKPVDSHELALVIAQSTSSPTD
jgi:CheY-like chemotaxis protein